MASGCECDRLLLIVHDVRADFSRFHCSSVIVAVIVEPRAGYPAASVYSKLSAQCSVFECCVVVVANLRRQAAADRSASDQVVNVDACTSSQGQSRPPRLEQNGRSAPGVSRRRTRKKRDSGAARTTGDADSTDASTEDAAAAGDMSRPKLRRRKKTRSKKTKKSNVECLRVESFSIAPAEKMVKMNSVGDIERLRVEDEIHQNGAAATTGNLSSSFVDVCIALPEVDGLSCEADGSSSRPEAEVIDYSASSTVDSSRNRSRSPTAQPSLLPVSTTASTSLYGQQSGGFVSDVHGSLPLLSRAFDNDRRLVTASDRLSTDACRRLPKSVSLQGYRHLLSVDGPTSGRHRHRRHLTAANYRPLAGQHGRQTLSRLDVEYINRSQIFEMISGQ